MWGGVVVVVVSALEGEEAAARNLWKEGFELEGERNKS